MFTLGTFNVRGLSKEYKQKQLSRDIDKYKVDICCLQKKK
jgi:mRNA deadenylase 3'-5' endonuclease subunit Ccr4